MASLSSAAYARKKLLGYGQPALKEIRSSATPALADAFHMFLLSLYDSLGQSAEPGPPTPGLHLRRSRPARPCTLANYWPDYSATARAIVASRFIGTRSI